MIVELLAAGHTEEEIVEMLVANGERESEARFIIDVELGRVTGDKVVVPEETS